MAISAALVLVFQRWLRTDPDPGLDQDQDRYPEKENSPIQVSTDSLKISIIQALDKL